MNHSINFFRLIYTLIIAFWHFPMLSKGILGPGYIVVEFFFILSGYFLYQSYRQKRMTAYDYTKERIKKFWLKAVLITLLISVINKVYIHHSLNDILHYFAKVFLLLKDILPFNDNITIHNTPLWYLSVLIWGGGLLYTIISMCPKRHKSILAIICVICYVIIVKY